MSVHSCSVSLRARPRNVDSTDQSTPSRIVDVKSPMISLTSGWSGNRRNWVRLIVNRGSLLQ